MRTDVVLSVSDTLDFYDISFGADGDFATTEGLDTALLLSVLEEQRATVDEVADPAQRRGWMGSEDEGFAIGSKLWLWDSARLTQSTLNGINKDVAIGLNWVIEQGLASSIDVSSTFIAGGLELTITVESDGSVSENVMYQLWGNTNAIGV
jgi:phage gp46-like protein